MPAHWLMKSEPSTYSIEDLRRDKTTAWSGVRNYQARNFMRAMKAGDLAFFYHSSAEPAGVAGIMEIAKAAYPEPGQDKPVWSQVDVRFVKAFPRVLAAGELKAVPALKGMKLFQASRLSVQPVTAAEWDAVLKLVRTA